MGSRNRMMSLSSRSGIQNGRHSPYGQGRSPIGGSGGMGGGQMPGLLEQKIQSQHMEIQALLAENQRLAATHVALRQELASAQQEMQRLTSLITGVQSEKDAQIRSLLEKAAKLELELRSSENVKQELVQARADCQKLHLHSQDLTQQVRTTTQELQRALLDIQQIPVLRGEMDNIRAELLRARTAFEFEKKTNAEQLELRQAMEQNLVAVARDLEKLKAEAANAEKRARMNPGGVVYNGGFNGAEAAYGVLPHYGDGCGMHSQEGVPVANGAMESDYGKSLQEAAKVTAAQGLSNPYHAPTAAQDSYRVSGDGRSTEEWATHQAPNGKPFYHNLITGTTQWEKPAALETQNQVTNAQALQTAANHIIASHALSSLMNGQVERNPIATQVLQQQQLTGASLIPQHQSMTQQGASGAHIPQGPVVGQVPVGYVQTQQPGTYTYVGGQMQMQQPGSYHQHPGIAQTQAGLIHQAVAPTGIQIQTPVVISAPGQAPQTTAPAPMPHLVHGHLSYPGTGVPAHASNGIQHPSAGSQIGLLPVTIAQQPVLQSPQTQTNLSGPRPGGYSSTTAQQQQVQQQQLQQQQQQQVQQQQQQQQQVQQQQQLQQQQTPQQQPQPQQPQQQPQQQETQSIQGSTKPGQTVVKTAASTDPSPSSQTQPQVQATGGAKLFVFGIPEDLGDKKLADLFTPFGTVIYAKVGVEKETGRNRTYGFVSMDSSKSAEAAINQVNGMVISGKRIKVELKRGETENQTPQNQSNQQTQQHQYQVPSSSVGPIRWNHNNTGNSGYRPY